ncbi:hypothetical protein U1Q18_012612, partial [Sarracenia purpurea var. burkii]
MIHNCSGPPLVWPFNFALVWSFNVALSILLWFSFGDPHIVAVSIVALCDVPLAHMLSHLVPLMLADGMCSVSLWFQTLVIIAASVR